MDIKLIDIQSADEDFGPYLHFEIPEHKFNGFINIDEWYDSDWQGLHYTEDFFMETYQSELLGLVENWIHNGNLLKFETGVLPKWDNLDPLVYNLINAHGFEMGFINPSDYDGDMDLFNDRVNGFRKALEKYPALSNVIELDETRVSLMRNNDAVIMFGDCMCYVNWYGWEEE